MWHKLFRRLRFRGALKPVPLPHLQVLLYTRQGCHLCDQAWQRLEKARCRYGFVLSTIDVDTDPELQRQYGTTVPVVLIDGKLRFRGAINDALLTRLLNAEASRKR